MKILPQASVVADRFHVIQLVNRELNSARHALMKANAENPDETVKEQVNAALKQSKYALLKPEENLMDKQQLKLAEVQVVSPRLASMHQQKEALRAIFETSRY